MKNTEVIITYYWNEISQEPEDTHFFSAKIAKRHDTEKD